MVLFDKYITEQEEIIVNRSMTILKVQMIGPGNVSIQGTLDDAPPETLKPANFNSLAGINDTNFNVVYIIDKEGSYSYDVTGMTAIKIRKSSKDLRVKVVGVE